MEDQGKVKLAVIGTGTMGREHVKHVLTLPQTELVAVCDVNQALVEKIAGDYHIPAYTDFQTMLDEVDLDGIIIATPHYDHLPVARAAFKKGIHVLVEKPIAVHVKDGMKMIEAYQIARQSNPNLIFGAVFMQRTYGYYRKIKSLIDEGELGKLVRATWIITDWFRTQAYYDSGGWRATWAGEGGGVLLNQSPHNIDLFQWIMGMPDRVTGFVTLGKYHHIEVEDEVTAYFEYDNGMVGHFITSTAEAPGTNRLEIVGENGKLIFEGGILTFYRNRQSMFDLIKEAKGGFDKGETWKIEVPHPPHNHPGHKQIIANFANAILHDEPLIAPAEEGLNSVMLANAILLSSFNKQTINLPIDADAYEAKLNELIANSRHTKNTTVTLNDDVTNSFQ